ncbi:hypothetical protein LguiA_015327 [Lonicera macranthoides]
MKTNELHTPHLIGALIIHRPGPYVKAKPNAATWDLLYAVTSSKLALKNPNPDLGVYHPHSFSSHQLQAAQVSPKSC